MNDFQLLSLIELQLVADLPRCRSLRSWAQGHKISVVKATRLLQNIETVLGKQIATRTTRGVVANPTGIRLSAAAQKVILAADHLKSQLSAEEPYSWARELTIVSRGFLNTAIAAPISEAAMVHGSKIGLRFVDASPSEAIAAAKSGMVEMVVGFEDVTIGKTWKSELLGHVEWRVYGRQNHPLAVGANAAELGGYLLGRHAYWDGEKIVVGDGMLFSSLKIPHMGHAAQTAATAAAVAAATDQLVCIPAIVANDFVRLGRLCEIAVKDLPSIDVPLYFWFDTEKVPAPLCRRIKAALAGLLK